VPGQIFRFEQLISQPDKSLWSFWWAAPITKALTDIIQEAEMLHRPWKPLVTPLGLVGIALALSYIVYRFVDPLPPRHFAIAAGNLGSPYDNFARQYGTILAQHDVRLDIRNTVNTVENVELIRDATSGVQAALTTFGFTGPQDTETLYSLGGVYDAAIFVFYRGTEPITRFSKFRGKRVATGPLGSALRSLMYEVLQATDALDGSTQIFDLDYSEAVDALIAGNLDVAIFPSQLDGNLLQRALNASGVMLMSVSQAEALAKMIPGLKHVVLSRGLISLSRDLPSSDLDLLAFRSRVLVRRDLHPALQYLLLEAMREVHWAPGPFNRLGEFPAEEPNDLPLSPTAEAFYRSGPTFWQRYTSFWLASLLNRIIFFVIPIVALLIPVLGFGPRFYRWVHVRQINRLHRALGKVEQAIAHPQKTRPVDQTRIAEIEDAVRSLKVTRGFEIDLHLLKLHLRMVQEEMARVDEPNSQR
jgi:uncharacterized protein